MMALFKEVAVFLNGSWLKVQREHGDLPLVRGDELDKTETLTTSMW